MRQVFNCRHNKFQSCKKLLHNWRLIRRTLWNSPLKSGSEGKLANYVSLPTDSLAVLFMACFVAVCLLCVLSLYLARHENEILRGCTITMFISIQTLCTTKPTNELRKNATKCFYLNKQTNSAVKRASKTEVQKARWIIEWSNSPHDLRPGKLSVEVNVF